MKEASSRRRRIKPHLPWMGLLIVLIGAMSYFMVFAKFPVTRDVPWVNLPIVFLGVVLALIGSSGWRSRKGMRNRVGAITCGVLSVAFAALFVAYIYIISSNIPKPTSASTELAQSSDFTLPNQVGKPVSLSDYTGRRVVISFFRGYW